MDNFFDFDFEAKNEASPSKEPASTPNTGLPSVVVPFATKPLKPRTEDSSDLAEERRDLAAQNDHEVQARTQQLLNANRGLIMRAFPGKTQRLILVKERLMVENALDFRVNLLKLSTQFKIEAIRDKYDAALKAYKAQNRVALIQFFLGKFNELNQSVKDRELEGLQILTGMYRNAQVIESPMTRAKYLDRVADREDRYLSVVDKLLKSYEVILDEHLEL